jgi:hypothetical protein
MSPINVVFRIYPKTNEVIALFPEIIENNITKSILSYMKIGQHSSADYHYVVKQTKLASKEQYNDLYNELTNSVGYDLRVLKKSKVG